MCRKRDAGAHVRLVFLQRPSEYNTHRNFRNSPNFPRDGDTRSPALSPLRPSTTLSPARSKWKKGRDKKETARDSARVRCARRRGGPNAIHRILKSRFLQVARDNGPVYKYEPIPKFETITRRREGISRGGNWGMDREEGTRRWSKVKLVGDWERRPLPLPSWTCTRDYEGDREGPRGTRPTACQEIAISLRLLDGDKCRPSPRG